MSMLHISLLCILNMKVGFYPKTQVNNTSCFFAICLTRYVDTVTVIQRSLATVNEVKMDCGGNMKTVRNPVLVLNCDDDTDMAATSEHGR